MIKSHDDFTPKNLPIDNKQTPRDPKNKKLKVLASIENILPNQFSSYSVTHINKSRIPHSNRTHNVKVSSMVN